MRNAGANTMTDCEKKPSRPRIGSSYNRPMYMSMISPA
jgi:hypothetical protein